MKKFLRGGAIILMTLAISIPAQAQTVEERLTALETSMANVELLSTQLFQLFSALQPDITAILNALATQQLEVATLQASMTAVQSDVSALQTGQTELQASQGTQDTDISELQTRLNGVSRTGNTLLLTNMNLQVVSGSGSTDGGVNGRGNIIIGYNEAIFPYLGADLPTSNKTGSHNLIVGKGSNYSSYGAIVSGLDNISSNPYGS